jgi:hypothetical protein
MSGDALNGGAALDLPAVTLAAPAAKGAAFLFTTGQNRNTALVV